MSRLLLRIFGWLFLLSLGVAVLTWLRQDDLPPPETYGTQPLPAPRQQPTSRRPFAVDAGGQRYQIEPLFDYELQGVVVSYHDADSFVDITHHDRWQDFLNLRDLCVLWGDNVRSGVYLDMDFSNDTWTCWAYWPDGETGARFRMDELSNNHLLTTDPAVQDALMAARPGDRVRFKGMLARYSNPANGFSRGTSTTRDDRGNGACETVYLTDFEVVAPANGGARALHRAASWVAGLSLAGFLVAFVVAPVGALRGR